MKTLITLSLLLFGSLLTAQNVRVAIEAGINGSGTQDLGHTFGGSAEYAFPLDTNTRLILGAGYQRLNYEKTPVTGRRQVCPGLCFFDYTEAETYTLRSSDVSLNIGLERRFGKWFARLTASPTYRAGAKLSARFITIPDDQRRPNTKLNFTVKPGEHVFFDNNGFATIEYDKDFYFQLGLEAGYALSPRIDLGLSYRRIITNYEVVYSSGGCGFVECFTSEQTRFDARTGNLLATVRYVF